MFLVTCEHFVSSTVSTAAEVVIPIARSRDFVYRMKTRLIHHHNSEDSTRAALFATFDSSTGARVDSTTVCFSNRNMLQAFFPVSFDYRPEIAYGGPVADFPNRVEVQNALISLRDGHMVVNPRSVLDHMFDDQIGYVDLREHVNRGVIPLFAYIHWESEESVPNFLSHQTQARPRGLLLNLTSTFDLVPHPLLEGLQNMIDTPVEIITENRTRRLRFECNNDIMNRLPPLIYSFVSHAVPQASNNIAVRIQMFPVDYLNFDESTNTCETRIRSFVINRAIGQLGVPFASVTTIVYDRNRVGFGEPIADL